MPRDPYQVLGVAREASEQDIKKSFRKLARELHPDVNAHDPQAEEKFKEAAEAYEILSDAERRATYDRYGHEGLRSWGYAPNFDAFGSIADLFDAFFGNSGGGGIFGSAGAGAGEDTAVAVEIDLAQAATPHTAEVRYEAIDRCEHCHGNGAEPGTPIERCERCSGAGQLQGVTRTPFGQMVRTVLCDACHGDGRVARVPCRECRGHGRRPATRTAQVSIPAGIADGQRIRVAGHGHVGAAGTPAGDLYVLVRVRHDERFLREGDDLIVVLDVSAPEASLGVSLQVPTLEGSHSLSVPPGTQPGEAIVLRGKGMPSLRGARRGDLRAIVNVVVPRHLSEEQRALTEQLAHTLTDANLRSEHSLLSKLKRALRNQSQ
jgi:molecular chaperone DnaJ